MPVLFQCYVQGDNGDSIAQEGKCAIATHADALFEV